MKIFFDSQSRVKPHVRSLSPYVPGEQPEGHGWVKLNTNENPYPPSPAVRPAILGELDKLRLYPEPVSRRLRRAIAAHFNYSEKNVIIGNGSDNLLDLITRCFVNAPGAGHTVPSYSLYPVVAGMSGQALVDLPFDRSMRLNIDAMAKARASVFFLTNPNAPTGVAFPLSTLEAALQAIDGLLVVDEAYVDFGGESAIPLLREYGNLIVVRTFSKAYSLAGMRVGFALGDEGIVGMLDRVRDAYNLDRIAQAAALAAFEDQSYFQAQCAKVIATREHTFAQLERLDWFTYPSATNFLFTEPKDATGRVGPEIARSLFQHLKQKRVLVRYFPDHPLTCSFIRVTIGTEEDMKSFLTIVDAWLNNA